MAGETIVSVLVPVAVAAPYTYRAPADVRPGDIVAVPLGTREVVGVVWDDPPDPVRRPQSPPADRGSASTAPPLSKEIRAFVDWVADYTLTSRGMVLRMVLRSPRRRWSRNRRFRAFASPVRRRTRMTPARARVLAAFSSTDMAWTKSGLAAAAGVSSGVVQGLDRRRHARSRDDARRAAGARRRSRLRAAGPVSRAGRRRQRRCAPRSPPAAIR